MPCDLNSASVGEMVDVLQLTEATARDLLLWRPYRDWEEVALAGGLSPPDLAALQARGAVLSAPTLAHWLRPLH